MGDESEVTKKYNKDFEMLSFKKNYIINYEKQLKAGNYLKDNKWIKIYLCNVM